MYTIFVIAAPKVRITIEEYEKIVQLLDSPEVGHFRIRDSVIFKHSISAIMPSEYSDQEEENKLLGKGYFKCNAGKVHKAGLPSDPHAYKCNCQENRSIAASMKKIISSGAKLKDFPKTTYQDMLQSRKDQGEGRANNIK